MDSDAYLFAELDPRDIARIEELERQLSASSGTPVTLIAYRPTDDAEPKRLR